ncbi:alpha/beta hydrolase [Mangrovimonas sp. AS39]|uniref:alpha/beta hydrolase n=1 Tax=Mangrovimonas futianensis TaxID=2895523 RepID=UPI001E647BC4|nr:alpha/beta hydrolase [Mangrovimonas futianensis]MCF1191016.1 alpha/beta hydrolase [Mangrovimonas futianensis]MCF1194711.1 alpha/beta hydrolase [Mangrovimonas futianensis]
MIQRLVILLILLVGYSVNSQTTTYSLKENLAYYENGFEQDDAYIKERCKLDIYYPTNQNGFATIVWFHGGGLTSGNKEIPESLKNKGLAVVAVNYRLYPKVKAPAYIEDAAAAVSWVYRNIERYGGDASLIFVSGHSAGGYLASMVGLDKSWLEHFDMDADKIAGLIPFSGHTITHFTVREERGIKGTQAIVDYLAPLYHVRPDAPPMLLITGDRDLELLGRYEETAYFHRMMQLSGHSQVQLFELEGYDHGGMAFPAFPLLVKEINRVKKALKEK